MPCEQGEGVRDGQDLVPGQRLQYPLVHGRHLHGAEGDGRLDGVMVAASRAVACGEAAHAVLEVVIHEARVDALLASCVVFR